MHYSSLWVITSVGMSRGGCEKKRRKIHPRGWIISNEIVSRYSSQFLWGTLPTDKWDNEENKVSLTAINSFESSREGQPSSALIVFWFRNTYRSPCWSWIASSTSEYGSSSPTIFVGMFSRKDTCGSAPLNMPARTLPITPSCISPTMLSRSFLMDMVQ